MTCDAADRLRLAELRRSWRALSDSLDDPVLVAMRAAQARAVQATGLVPGKILREREVWAGLDRLGDASQNALVPDDPSYRVEAGPDGSRLTLRVSRRSVAIAAGPNTGSRITPTISSRPLRRTTIGSTATPVMRACGCLRVTESMIC